MYMAKQNKKLKAKKSGLNLFDKKNRNIYIILVLGLAAYYLKKDKLTWINRVGGN